MTEKNWKLLNGLALAYMGDGIYEVYVRNHVMQKGLTKPNQLHATATKFVSAKAQARLMQQMLEQIYKRGRNSKSHTVAKNADVGTYRIATGFEALMGYLYLSGQKARLEELINWCLQQVEGEQ